MDVHKHLKAVKTAKKRFVKRRHLEEWEAWAIIGLLAVITAFGARYFL
jgi:hypothetical protein